jgi:hypothetical protein
LIDHPSIDALALKSNNEKANASAFVLSID